MENDLNINVLGEMVYSDNTEGKTILVNGTYKGYEIRVISYGTHPCCYIKLAEGHKYHGKNYDDIPLGVHGGLTFSDNVKQDERWSDGWWIGWDYAHLGDRYGNYEDGEEYSTLELLKDLKCAVDELETL